MEAWMLGWDIVSLSPPLSLASTFTSHDYRRFGERHMVAQIHFSYTANYLGRYYSTINSYNLQTVSPVTVCRQRDLP
jgi:hypothetical protein